MESQKILEIVANSYVFPYDESKCIDYKTPTKQFYKKFQFYYNTNELFYVEKRCKIIE